MGFVTFEEGNGLLTFFFSELYRRETESLQNSNDLKQKTPLKDSFEDTLKYIASNFLCCYLTPFCVTQKVIEP